MVEDAFRRVLTVPRVEALKKVMRTTTEREPFVLTYHPLLPSVTKVIKKHWKVMTEHSNRLRRCFQKPSLVAYKRSKNLSDILVRAKVSNRRKSRRKLGGFAPCGRLCVACCFCKKANTHSCHKTGETWNISAPIDCQTTNVVYKLSCHKCPEWVYVGETSRRFCDRLQEHRGYIRQKKLNAVGVHFNSKGHSLTDLLPLAFERVLPKGNQILRRNRESLWIKR